MTRRFLALLLRISRHGWVCLEGLRTLVPTLSADVIVMPLEMTELDKNVLLGISRAGLPLGYMGIG